MSFPQKNDITFLSLQVRVGHGLSKKRCCNMYIGHDSNSPRIPVMASSSSICKKGCGQSAYHFHMVTSTTANVSLTVKVELPMLTKPENKLVDLKYIIKLHSSQSQGVLPSPGTGWALKSARGPRQRHTNIVPPMYSFLAGCRVDALPLHCSNPFVYTKHQSERDEIRDRNAVHLYGKSVPCNRS